jgi:2-phospho-L-lactate transferase/gluconeogenesis factor (CofD/UPF0052 family)
MTQPGETGGMDTADHVETIFNYIDEGSLDHALLNDKKLADDELVKYTSGGAAQLIADDDEKARIRSRGVNIIEGGFIDIQRGYVKHDADAVAYIVRTLTRNHMLGHE